MVKQSLVRILVLGSNPETAEIVRVANDLGYVTFVINPFENSPSKDLAAFSYNADPRNASQIDEIIRREGINAVILGVSDPLLPYYKDICERHKFPCYANENSTRIFSSKFEFSEYCKLFDIQPIPNYDLEIFSTNPSGFNGYPVVVKPIDSGAAVGVSLCENEVELKAGVQFALSKSLSKKVIVEKYMNCDDLFAYYSVLGGRAQLSMLADRYKSTKSGKLKSVCLYADYPSKHLGAFLEGVNSKIIRMIESLEIENGVLGIQVFYNGSEFYAYDPGFRLQGEGPHFYLNVIQKFDQIKMLLDFAIGGNGPKQSNTMGNDPTLNGYLARTIWILGNPGVVSEIKGLDELSKIPNVIKVLNRFSPGELITEDMVGTERQVLMRIYTIGKTHSELKSVSQDISNIVRVSDNEGRSLISDIYVPFD